MDIQYVVMKSLPVLTDLTAANMGSLPCCGVKNPEHEGRRQKTCWMAANYDKGLKAKVLLTPDNRQCGYIEYLPGEYAWRGVDAAGYMFIHCIWTFYKEYKGRGYGSAMVQACVEDARKAGMNGVAVVVRDSPWAAGAALFEKNGFEPAAEAPPDYRLLVRKLKPEAPAPAFKGGWEAKLKKYGRGLTILVSNQCPHIAKFAGEIANSARKDYGLTPKVMKIRSYREAQNAPTPYAVFAIIYDGRILSDHQISRTRFRNIMNKLPGGFRA